MLRTLKTTVMGLSVSVLLVGCDEPTDFGAETSDEITTAVKPKCECARGELRFEPKPGAPVERKGDICYQIALAYKCVDTETLPKVCDPTKFDIAVDGGVVSSELMGMWQAKADELPRFPFPCPPPGVVTPAGGGQ